MEPTTMPAMAPPERWWWCLLTGFGVVEEVGWEVLLVLLSEDWG